MKLFGRKQQSMPVIPPELQPYYGNTPNHSFARQVRRFFILVIVLLVVAAAAWAVTRYGSNLHFGSKPTPKKTTQSQQAPQDNSSTRSGTSAPAQTPSSGSTNTAPVSPPPAQ